MTTRRGASDMTRPIAPVSRCEFDGFVREVSEGKVGEEVTPSARIGGCFSVAVWRMFSQEDAITQTMESDAEVEGRGRLANAAF